MIPAARQRVRVEGRTGVFFVLTVNQDLGYADLVELNSATLVEAVRFERISRSSMWLGRTSRCLPSDRMPSLTDV